MLLHLPEQGPSVHDSSGTESDFSIVIDPREWGVLKGFFLVISAHQSEGDEKAHCKPIPCSSHCNRKRRSPLSGLLVVNTSFCHRRHLLTWCPLPSQRSTQVDHVTIAHLWRGLVEDCYSFWFTSVNSNPALVCPCLFFYDILEA